MTNNQVSNEEFLTRLTALFEASSAKHSVFVSQKRITRQGQPGSSTGTLYPVVVRATDGAGSAEKGRTKFTTHVEADKIAAFQDAYSTVLRASMASFLKKRDKAKERRADKQLKEKRKGIEESAMKGPSKVSAVGSKRGAGRRKRQQAESKAAKVRKERRRQQRAAQSTANAASAAGNGSGNTKPTT